ncbi:MAG: hypothetical protein HY461_01465 [Parcubacteria group bacterium]|nr:hypothetical protein [Parcubacteria group bacterium]
MAIFAIMLAVALIFIPGSTWWAGLLLGIIVFVPGLGLRLYTKPFKQELRQLAIGLETADDPAAPPSADEQALVVLEKKLVDVQSDKAVHDPELTAAQTDASAKERALKAAQDAAKAAPGDDALQNAVDPAREASETAGRLYAQRRLRAEEMDASIAKLSVDISGIQSRIAATKRAAADKSSAARRPIAVRRSVGQIHWTVPVACVIPLAAAIFTNPYLNPKTKDWLPIWMQPASRGYGVPLKNNVPGGRFPPLGITTSLEEGEDGDQLVITIPIACPTGQAVPPTTVYIDPAASQ